MRLVVTREDYFEAALAVLAQEGHHALKMTPLCRSLGVTTGSFYNYFGSWENFPPELLAYWEREKTVRLLELATAARTPRERRATMRRLVSELPHEAESAIRAWGNGDPGVASVLHRVDEERLDAIRTVIADTVTNRRRADLLARMGLSILVGIQCLRTPVDPAELLRILEEFDRLVAEESLTSQRSRAPRRPSAKAN
jgi:AcrR family transcriptional regulator